MSYLHLLMLYVFFFYSVNMVNYITFWMLNLVLLSKMNYQIIYLSFYAFYVLLDLTVEVLLKCFSSMFWGEYWSTVFFFLFLFKNVLWLWYQGTIGPIKWIGNVISSLNSGRLCIELVLFFKCLIDFNSEVI